MNAHLYMAHNGRMSMNYIGIGGIFFAENTEIRQKNGWCDTLKRNWSYRRHCFPAGAAKRYRQQNEYCLNIPEYHPEKYPYIVQSVMPLASCWNLLHPAFSVRPVEKPACLTSLSSRTARTIKFGCFKILYIPQKPALSDTIYLSVQEYLHTIHPSKLYFNIIKIMRSRKFVCQMDIFETCSDAVKANYPLKRHPAQSSQTDPSTP